MPTQGPLIVERARAKVNLTLKVLGKRAGGYHELESVVAFADVADVVTLDVGRPVSVIVCGPFGPAITGDNLVCVALDNLAVAEPALKLGKVILEKNLPVAAGIGGGSADAAAVMRAVRRANPNLENTIDWMALAAQLGADVPVCFHDGPAIMRGTGDRLQPIDNLPPLNVVLVNPQVPVPADKTARVFRALGAKPLDPSRSMNEVADIRFSTRDALLAFMASTGNDLLVPASQIVPGIAHVLEVLGGCAGAELASLSGGGRRALRSSKIKRPPKMRRRFCAPIIRHGGVSRRHCKA